jgi:hypothetical protein
LHRDPVRARETLRRIKAGRGNHNPTWGKGEQRTTRIRTAVVVGDSIPGFCRFWTLVAGVKHPIAIGVGRQTTAVAAITSLVGTPIAAVHHPVSVTVHVGTPAILGRSGLAWTSVRFIGNPVPVPVMRWATVRGQARLIAACVAAVVDPIAVAIRRRSGRIGAGHAGVASARKEQRRGDQRA